MNKKVTLTEIVGTKIIYALIMVSYYWMWARSDWKDYYETIQLALSIFLVVFFMIYAKRIKKYKKESMDEMAEYNLKRCDSICFKIFIIVMIVTAFVCAILGHSNTFSCGFIGWIIVLTILVLTIVRTVIFIVMDSRGI